MRNLFAQTAEKIFEHQISTALREEADEGIWPEKLWREISESGLTMALVREAAGGVNASFGESFSIALVAGKFAAPVPLVENMIANYFLDQCSIECPAGVTTLSKEVLILAQGNVSGSLADVPFGVKSDYIVSLAQHGHASHLVLLKSSDAVSAKKRLNMAREPRDTLTFDETSPVAIAPLPSHLDGTALLRGGALMRSAQISGALEEITNMTAQYAGEREQFGRPIVKFQAIQQLIAQLAEQSVLAHTSADRAFHDADFNPNSISIPVAKIISSESASLGSALAHSIHGAIGFTHEYSLHFFTRRLWSWRAEFGTATYWADQLGNAACRQGADSIWPAITGHGFAEQI